MIELTIQDILALIESTEVEFKSAQGRDGLGELPQSFWETYSAMANTSGGHIYLGIEETRDHKYVCRGIQDTDKIQKVLWDTINNKHKVNRNVLSIHDVQIIRVDNCNLLDIRVPRARRQDRPVYVGASPFGNTYVRQHEGDYKADDETVRRMIAEAVEDSRDDRILEYFGIDDLEKETVNAYRNRFASLKPESPWLDLSLEDFLLRIGVMGKDRVSGKSGLRVAGLLMFGRYDTIKEVFPHYMVDYQERPEPKKEVRWIDRITPDGTWSGNLYDFFQKTMRKLTADLKVPFQLELGIRKDDTPVHEALREALTNTLIHADFTGRVSILIVKRPDLFGFRNPGLMRVSIDQAITGGISDCRNHRIQDLFRFIGLGEHAGSGIPKIYKNWKSQHWRAPSLYEDRQHEQTLLELRMISLMPEESIKKLDDLFGDRLRSLPELERVILITAMTEGKVYHSRIKEISTDHPKDISSALAHLVQMDMLEKEGETRASVYYIPGLKPLDSYLPFMALFQKISPDLNENADSNSPDLNNSSPDLKANSPDLKLKLVRVLNSMGYQTMPGKFKNEEMKKVIMALCLDAFITLKELGIVLERNPKSLQDQYLTSMIKDGFLGLRFPDNKNHPEQAYRSKNHEQ
ncbi:MAG: putative DNA binding domain-containing protein [Desulfobacterales bacterium]|nr:putative DNA binding domain-containing protein [Desulfobacterales bacterium]MBF0395911.1 putative DNA binding domain-containing protein [Desulfobacterales bacterium]